jgi:MoxR-like ATPase
VLVESVRKSFNPKSAPADRAEAIERLYAVLVKKQDKALLHGEPGCGKSTLALKFLRLVLDDIWENDVKALAPVDFAGSFAGSNKLLARRGGVDFPNLPRR